MCIKIYTHLSITILILTTIYLDKAYSEGSSKYINYEYTQIFQSIPALFEYLLGTVEENPEILERNDISIFKRSIAKENMDTKSDKYDENFDKKLTINENKKVDNGQKRSLEHDIIYDYQTEDTFTNIRSQNAIDNNNNPNSYNISSPNINSFIDTLDHNNRNIDLKSNTEQDLDSENIVRHGTEPNFETAKLNKDVSSGSSGYLISEDSYEADFGSPTLFRLDVQSEDIKQSVLMTEKLLEDFNEQRIKNSKGS